MDLFINVKLIDILSLVLLTIPFFVFYILFISIYFFTKDRNTEKLSTIKKHGLSRFLFIGIVCIFGLIIFNLIVEFITAFLYELGVSEKAVEFYANFNDYIILKSLSKGFRRLPNYVLININIIAIIVYMGLEGHLSALKTLKLDNGIVVELPQLKRLRLSMFFIIWFYTAIIATIYTMVIGDETIKFDLYNIYIGMGSSLIILIFAERTSSNIAAGKKQKIETVSKDNISVETVVSTDKINEIKDVVFNERIIALDNQNTSEFINLNKEK